MGIETEFPQFHTPKTQKQKSRIARVRMRKEISQFSLNPLSSRSSLSRTITRNSKLKESANSKAKPKGRKLVHGADDWCGVVQAGAALVRLVRPWCMKCCPARAKGRAGKVGAPESGVEGRAGNFGAARIELGAPDAARNVPWCARCCQERAMVRQICFLVRHTQNAALPSRRAGQCFHFAVPCSKHGCGTRSINFLGFLARQSTLSPSFLMVPCSNLVACMGDIFPLNSFLGEPDTALVEGRARFSSSWSQGTFCALPLEWAGQGCLLFLVSLCCPPRGQSALVEGNVASPFCMRHTSLGFDHTFLSLGYTS
ncbi:uncharacterized protein DS421_5g143130 [Arachis hypogaea]|nr:uncharacterized protein DS421_5g143130 [Arachis hypogaea]